MNPEGMTFVMISETDLNSIKSCLQDIQQQLKTLNSKGEIPVKHITAIEFMAAVRIRRTKFDELVKFGQIQVVKKRRRVYVPIEEVERYFADASVR